VDLYTFNFDYEQGRDSEAMEAAVAGGGEQGSTTQFSAIEQDRAIRKFPGLQPLG
jgi:hypothetical protein